jgi:L-cystine uptake protein TcyP (sodium:dicarboxylate symporter family)
MPIAKKDKTIEIINNRVGNPASLNRFKKVIGAYNGQNSCC